MQCEKKIETFNISKHAMKDNEIIRVCFRMTPCRKSNDSILRLLFVYHKDKYTAAGKGEMNSFDEKKIKEKKSKFLDKSKLTKIHKTLVETLMEVGKLSNRDAVIAVYNMKDKLKNVNLIDGCQAFTILNGLVKVHIEIPERVVNSLLLAA